MPAGIWAGYRSPSIMCPLLGVLRLGSWIERSLAAPHPALPAPRSLCLACALMWPSRSISPFHLPGSLRSISATASAKPPHSSLLRVLRSSPSPCMGLRLPPCYLMLQSGFVGMGCALTSCRWCDECKCTCAMPLPPLPPCTCMACWREICGSVSLWASCPLPCPFPWPSELLAFWAASSAIFIAEWDESNAFCKIPRESCENLLGEDTPGLATWFHRFYDALKAYVLTPFGLSDASHLWHGVAQGGSGRTQQWASAMPRSTWGFSARASASKTCFYAPYVPTLPVPQVVYSADCRFFAWTAVGLSRMLDIACHGCMAQQGAVNFAKLQVFSIRQHGDRLLYHAGSFDSMQGTLPFERCGLPFVSIPLLLGDTPTSNGWPTTHPQQGAPPVIIVLAPSHLEIYCTGALPLPASLSLSLVPNRASPYVVQSITVPPSCSYLSQAIL